MENLDLKSLTERYNNGSLFEEKRDILESWYFSEVKSDNDDKAVEENLAKLDQNFKHIVGTQEKKGFKLWLRVAVAASQVAVLGLSLCFYRSNSPDTAGNMACITLGNGKCMVLAGASNSIITEQTGVHININVRRRCDDS